ncbi:hypothetical protein FA13DRAFT_1794186 [Coprinellus micaceus]|uniref:GATA-type domain-containing protein n=1 Tax=Coprinellus micaceus TaxID=71717 RepID=A0A4Y7T237_COPMI|nr:hypothetical protein FA13DRAFT_1794186 [Coprinellus micaceus]
MKTALNNFFSRGLYELTVDDRNRIQALKQAPISKGATVVMNVIVIMVIPHLEELCCPMCEGYMSIQDEGRDVCATCERRVSAVKSAGTGHAAEDLQRPALKCGPIRCVTVILATTPRIEEVVEDRGESSTHTTTAASVISRRDIIHLPERQSRVSASARPTGVSACINCKATTSRWWMEPNGKGEFCKICWMLYSPDHVKKDRNGYLIRTRGQRKMFTTSPDGGHGPVRRIHYNGSYPSSPPAGVPLDRVGSTELDPMTLFPWVLEPTMSLTQFPEVLPTSADFGIYDTTVWRTRYA